MSIRRVLRGALLLFTLCMVPALPSPSHAEVSVGISVNFAPPALPVYVQPLPPGPGYIWSPGYWAWDPYYGYYWVPGTWVLAPYPGWLWTPGYWAWNDGFYVWYEGYWGPVVGFYGGINYGCGYNGYGYYGGYWRGNTFYYNRAVNNVGRNITTVYRNPVPRGSTVSRVSFNGGRNGVHLRPTAVQREAAGRRASAPVPAQREHLQAARRDPVLRASENHGRPAIAATPRPGELSGPGVVRAKRAGAPYRAPTPAQAGGARHPEAAPVERARPEHHPPASEAAPGHAMPPQGHHQQPPRGAVERPSPGEMQAPAERHQGAPREFSPAPEPRHGQPVMRQPGPPVEHAPPRQMPHPAPVPGGERFEPQGMPQGQPGGGGRH